MDKTLRVPLTDEESAQMRSNIQETREEARPETAAAEGTLFSESTFERDDLTRILRECGDAPTFEHCDFSGEDLSRLDFRAARFTRCI
ncbi:MAG TPA: hypothetical protein VG320_14140, partial [Paraburkholderia sp.]|nr:hypothetical protein [Paraburkholderia sp.]